MAVSNFVAGDLVISISGDGDGSGAYADNQASPIVLEQIDPATGLQVAITGTFTNATLVNGNLVLPQTVTSGSGENVISGEYGSSSEGTLQLSADGHSLVIAGYGVNASTYNAAEAGLSPSGKQAGGIYGNAALAQTYSVPTGGTNGAPAGDTVVPRVIADINANGSVDTSTALLNVDNENNPRSVTTADGSSFYVSGQGVSGDTTQGVAYATDGATSATAINTATDTRSAEIYNGNLYVSANSGTAMPSGDKTAGIEDYGTAPTAATTPTTLAGIGPTVTLTAGQANGINDSRVGNTVYLAPENFYFANSTTLYIADDGKPKNGNVGKAGLGDGGLQKWTLNTNSNTWSLDYTLSTNLTLVANSASAGTTGLIGLTGSVSGNTVSLYATNATVNDTDPTYVYGINDQLDATTAPAGESFTKLFTAAPDTNVRGVAFAPQAATTCYCTGTLIRTTSGDVAVESLSVGDFAVTLAGAHRPIRWIGQRRLDPRRHPRPQEAQPVRIRAGALGVERPARDLVVSPGHSICVDVLGQVLIPAMALVNGSTVVQEDVESVTYWHVELETHDILLAENIGAESYLDMGNRAFFARSSSEAEEGTIVDLTSGPDVDPSERTHADFCRPFHGNGALVDVVRAQMRRRATAMGWTTSDELSLHLDVDGHRVAPVLRGLTARFELPAGARNVWLIAPTARPYDVSGTGDQRKLGLFLDAVRIEDGFAPPLDVAIDDRLLCAGFFGTEAGGRRWTTGRAHLPAELWADRDTGCYLCIDMAAPPVARWVAPQAVGQLDTVDHSPVAA